MKIWRVVYYHKEAMGSKFNVSGLYHSIESARQVFDRFSPAPYHVAKIQYMDQDGFFHDYESRDLNPLNTEVHIKP